MVKRIMDSPSAKNLREVTFRYDPNNKNDSVILKKISEVVLTEQPLCSNCGNFCYEGCFGGYNACTCKIHGNLEAVGNPHYDGDGSKCDDYYPKENV